MDLLHTSLIISNSYNHICELYPLNYNLTNKQKYIDINIAYELINKITLSIQDNKNISLLPEITLIGGDNDGSWDSYVVPLIQYIRKQPYFIKINLECENLNFLNNIKLDYCQKQQINLNLFLIDNNFNPLLLTNIIEKKPLTTITIYIHNLFFNNLHYLYTQLNHLNVKNVNFLFEEIQNNTYSLNLYDNINLIINEIKNIFNQEEIPLIPKNFQLNFLKIILNQNNKDKLNHSNIIDQHCYFLTAPHIIMNQDGELFVCSFDILNKQNPMYIGFVDIIKHSINHDKYQLNNFYNNHTTNIAPLFGENCSECPMYFVCSTGCPIINLTNNGQSNIPNKNYCTLSTWFYEKSLELMEYLDKQKNELFKNYLFGCTMKGTYGL